MTVNCFAKTCGNLTNGNIYDCLGIELDCCRIIDESEEDYLYPINEFKPVDEN